MTPDAPANRKMLRAAVALEGASLLLLVFVAVPVKHLLDLPLATGIMGPVHGLAFLFFLHALTEALAARAIPARASIRLLLGAMIPLGGLFNERWLARTERRNPPDV